MPMRGRRLRSSSLLALPLRCTLTCSAPGSGRRAAAPAASSRAHRSAAAQACCVTIRPSMAAGRQRACRGRCAPSSDGASSAGGSGAATEYLPMAAIEQLARKLSGEVFWPLNLVAAVVTLQTCCVLLWGTAACIPAVCWHRVDRGNWSPVHPQQHIHQQLLHWPRMALCKLASPTAARQPQGPRLGAVRRLQPAYLQQQLCSAAAAAARQRQRGRRHFSLAAMPGAAASMPGAAAAGSSTAAPQLLTSWLPISLLTDSYKTTHYLQYPPCTKMVAVRCL